MTTTEKLERLKHYSTRYELVAIASGERFLAGYTPRRSKSGLLDMIRKNGEEWQKRGVESLTFEKRGNAATMGKFSVAFSGRTQREAIIEGELPWFEDAIPTN